MLHGIHYRRSLRLAKPEAFARRSAIAETIHSSPARRQPQCRRMPGVLPQNGARDGQGCAATPCCARAGERAEVR